jgi:uncharacterized protein (DUF362 family)
MEPFLCIGGVPEVQASCLDELVSLAHADGGWGYRPDQAAHVEPTCLALLALSLDAGRYRESIARGCLALGRFEAADGAYRLDRGREQALWPTALVLFVQAALGYPRGEVERTASRLLALRGRVPDDPKAAEQHDIDHRLVGWPWAEGNFSWAEPTAWACLALRRAGCGGHPRVEEGLRLLMDRADDEGGINYGNRRIFGRKTEPQTEPTALMLLALQGREKRPRIDSAIAYLKCQALASSDLEQLCWAKIALDLYRGPTEISSALSMIDERIENAQRTRADRPWVQPAPLRLALIALASGASGNNVFRLEAIVPAVTVREVPAAPNGRPWAERIKSAFRGLVLEGTAKLRPLPAQSEVHIARADDYNADLTAILQTQFDAFRVRVPLAGKKVVLKPNLVEYHRDKVINTDPRVVSAVIELCKREGAAEVIVAEGPGHCRNVEFLVQASGLGEVLERHGIPFVDLNHDEPVKTLNQGRLTGLDYLYLSRTAVAADVLISLPKLKTHHWAGATLSLKNLFGTLPGICYGWPKNELHWRGIDNSIVDIALSRTPELAIVDGIVGMEGDGPLNGTPKPLGTLIMGTDLLAVDATCCRLMRLNVNRIGYLVLGQQKRLGHLREEEICQIGETIRALAQPFATLPHLRELCLEHSA